MTLEKLHMATSSLHIDADNPQHPLGNTGSDLLAPPAHEVIGIGSHPGGWGIDTVTLSYNVNPALSDPSSSLWQRSSSLNLRDDMPALDDMMGFLDLPNGRVKVILYTARDICHLHFNAAVLAHGKSEMLLVPEALTFLVESVIDAIREAVWPDFVTVDDNGEIIWDDDWTTHVRFKRIVIARNLVIADPALVKAALPSVKARYGKHQVQHKSGPNGWTIENKTAGSGTDRIYDKSADLEALELEDHLGQIEGRLFRFETQIQKDRLTQAHLSTLEQVNSEAAWDALIHRWEQTGWGSPLPTKGSLLDALEGLSPLLIQRLIGFLHLEAVGLSADVVTRTQIRESRTLCKKYGLTPGLPIDLLGPATQRIDLLAGALVPVA